MNYMPYDDGSGAAPMDDEDFHWQQPQAAPHAGEAQDGTAAHAGASRVNESQLPSTEDLHLWLAAIVERDGLEKLLEALLSSRSCWRRCSASRGALMLCAPSSSSATCGFRSSPSSNSRMARRCPPPAPQIPPTAAEPVRDGLSSHQTMWILFYRSDTFLWIECS